MRIRLFTSGLLIVTGAVVFACGSDDGGSNEGASGGMTGGTGGSPSGGSDSGSTGGKSNEGGTGGKGNMGGMGGGGGPTEPEPTYDVLGAWERTCDDLGMGGAMNDCLDEPWEVMLGEAVLGGPTILVSNGGPCGAEERLGTFTHTDGTLEFFNCGDGDPQNAPDAEGLRFDVRFASGGERMVLAHGETEYVLQRNVLPPTSLSSKRLLSVGPGGCDSFSQSMNFHTVDHDWTPAWSSTLALQGGELFMDEMFRRIEGTGLRGWDFYSEDHRGAQSADFPLEPATTASFYKIAHAADLTPVYAVGFEIDDCDDSAGAVRGLEYDFVRDVSHRRFWSTAQQSLDATSVLAVDGLEGSVAEVIVTVRTTNVSSGAEWTVSLTSPDGTTVEVVSGVIGDGSLGDLEYTSFADHATTSIADPELSSLHDLLAPQNLLSAFQGESKNGDWTLSVSVTGDSGFLNYFGLSIR